jgi:DNA-binding beta-propeller fold protein YncE
MSARTIAARRAVLRWRVSAAALISLAAGLGSVVPAPQAADAALTAGSPASRAASVSPGTAYVTNFSSGTVTPIATATNAAGPPIAAGVNPYVITITPDGKTAYVANLAHLRE